MAAAPLANPDVAAKALVLLLTGPALLPCISRDALLRQAQEVMRNKHAKEAERTMGHPLLLRRIARVYGIA